MNIEIANRLLRLRKANNLSQVELAKALKISCQEVDKWERVEASPDSDNLANLGKLYKLSIEELLKINQEEFEGAKEFNEDTKNANYVHVSFNQGIHIQEKNGDEMHIGWDGIHVHNSNQTQSCDVDRDKVGNFINGYKYDTSNWCKYYYQGYHYHQFPIGIIVTMVYLFIGFEFKAWHPGWIIFGIIPIFKRMISAFIQKDILCFSYPILVSMIVCYYGIVRGTWYPTWLLFLSIPVFYAIFGYLKHLKKLSNNDEEKDDI